MRSARVVVLLLVVAVVAALALSFDGEPAADSSGLEAAPIPSAGEPGTPSSTWYCSAGSAATATPPRHDLILVNPAGEPTTARLTAYGPDGAAGENVVEVNAPGPTKVDLDATFQKAGLSILVESPAGDLVVEHRLTSDTGADQVPCATRTSEAWHFPAQTSLQGTTAQLYLFNPFLEDASVDITTAVGDGEVRAPADWQGLVVPAGTSRMVDLGSDSIGAAQRRELFAASVVSRKGRVVAETAQTLATGASEDGTIPATSGLRLQLGVPGARSEWAFADGFTGTGVVERLVVFNPSAEPARASVQVTPYGGADLLPEPFEVDVPAHSWSQLDLSSETRIPTEGLHAIRVLTEQDQPVVAARVITIVGPRADPTTEGVTARPPVSAGTTIGTGTPVAAPLWAATGLVVGGSDESVLAVHNPSADTVRVTATVIGGAGDGSVLADALEVAPGDSLAIPTRDRGLGDTDVTVLVEATGPVVVERTLTFLAVNDLSVGLAVPLPTRGAGLTPIGR